MNSSKRTMEISIPIDAIRPYYEAVLHTMGVIKPREELIKLEISPDWKAPWNADTDVPLRLTIQEVKEVDRTEVDGKAKAQAG